MTAVDRPARGTRPANRRELIVAAATELFASRGYEHVSMGDVAAAVAVGPSALYRHFASKEQLLTEVVGDVADRFAASLATISELEQAVDAMATFALDHRSHGLLRQREARRLPPEIQHELRERTRQGYEPLTAAVSAARPTLAPDEVDIVTSAALAVVLSPSFHHLDLPRPEYDRVLADLARRVLAVEVPPDTAKPAPPGGLSRTSTRARLLEAAVQLFADRTYASVSMEDIGASIGITAASVYNHFPSKLDMLVTALNNGTGYLQIALDQALADAYDPADGLRKLVKSYCLVALLHPHLFDVLITEVRNLPTDDAEKALRAQRDYLDEWVQLLRQVHNGIDNTSARIVVHGALTVINNLVRAHRVRARSDAVTVVGALALQVLSV